VAEGRGLAEFLATLAGRKWEWGRTDCLMVLADWFVVQRGWDPVAEWRGTYSTEAECLRILEREGGIVSLVEKIVHGICPRTNSPQAGDIAIVRTPKMTGAICVSESMRAILTTDIGLLIANEKELPLVAAWRV